MMNRLIVSVVLLSGVIGVAIGGPDAVLWSFRGTLDDVSPQQKGPATLVQPSKLAFADSDPGGFLQIRDQGCVELPTCATGIIDGTFTVMWSMRVHESPSGPQTLLTTIARPEGWQIMSTLTRAGIVHFSMRRSSDSGQKDKVVQVSSNRIEIGKWVRSYMSWPR